ncbi:hypothetical protein IQ06DRAFT_367417 [Phaeosphaeriaceae sp. SRC1lsM3a]|nr:hypothetical protein IQ06DRAFT_367417 [Stagonospora sp. SRC1lsM3a]
MGQQPSLPKPGTKLQVIGAGLPRTGTSSFTQALSILLDGPAYHGGTQCTLGGEHEIRFWISALNAWPPKTPSDSSLIRSILRSRLDGYVAVTDSPCNGLVPELLELYPNALVICTVRDPDAWVKSMDTVANAATLSFLRIILFWMPTMRWFPDYVNALRRQWVTLYGRPEPATRHHWDEHVKYLERVVPKERLVWFDVREGWEPLCTALGKEVPDMEFPRINDGKAIEEMAKRMVTRGLMRWGVVVGSIGVAVVGWWWVR